MSREPDSREKSLEESLARVHDALARTTTAAPAKGRAPVEPTRSSPAGAIGSGAIATTLVVLAVVTGQWWLMVPALAFFIAAGFLAVKRLSEEFTASEHGLSPQTREKRPHIGMGATVASDAVLEPGAVVEMGATVGSGARIREGAIVRMGATVMENAVIEPRAVVSWGATVHPGAVVGSDAAVGAGSDIEAGAHVPPNMSLMPGSTFRASAGQAPALAATPAKPERTGQPVDPRLSRIDTICDRLETELSQSPESVRSFLGASSNTIAALRRTCHDLLKRERALRDESSGESLARLDSEKAVLESRIAAARDEPVRRSLQGAVAALEEQKRQRELLQRNADRLDAEFTRLSWTLEGMVAQMVRLRSVAPQSGVAPDPELEKSLHQLHSEIEAIAEALEHVSSGTEEPVAAQLPRIDESVSGSSDEEQRRADRSRQRDR
jgi:carbonic anhydrase/acetyltransferase-like protein (isoleucine patch superfamily)